MAETVRAGRSKHSFQSFIVVMHVAIAMLKEQYDCPHFRILVIGRANAGKTTILEKVCGVARGTKPIIFDEQGVELNANINPAPEPILKPRFKLINQILHRKPLLPLPTHLTPSVEVSCMHMNLHSLISNPWQRGIHNIEHQITYPRSNFIFHDSQGFESGANGEIEVVWKFIEKRSTMVRMKDQLHAIWYLSTGSLHDWIIML